MAHSVLLYYMRVEKIPYEHTGLFSQTVIDYITQRDDFKEFYNRFPNLPSFAQQVEEKRENYNCRKLISTVISEQYEDLDLTDRQMSNLDLLALPETYTITTGHQLCLFTGPLYFIFKICATIKLAEKLNSELKENVIPIFWMATEDHDLAEVDHTSVYGKEVRWHTEQTGAVGRMSLENIEEALSQLNGILGDGQHALEILAIMREAYSSDRSLAQATRYVVQSLFGDYGLLCIDGDSRELKAEFVNFMSEEIFNRVVEGSSARYRSMLSKRGTKIQAAPREINLFYLNGDSRKRLVPENADFRVLDTDLLFDSETLRSTIESHPERFSPNVLFRPVYQEFLLPNLAYIGGGGELAYWMELKEVFADFKVTFPLFVLRNSFVLIDDKTWEKWLSMGFGLNDLFSPVSELEKSYVLAKQDEELSILKEKKDILSSFERIAEKSKMIDPSMVQFTDSEKRKLEKSINTIEKKLIRAEKKKNETGINKIRSVREKLFPGGGLQERKENISQFYLKHGSEFIPMIVGEIDPLDLRLTVLIV